MKTRSRQTTGVELPRSGKGTRQQTFSLVLQWSGRFFSVERPLPSGPRQPGQFAAEADMVNPTPSHKTAEQRLSVWFVNPKLTPSDNGIN
jgi:hypothetical protein